MIVGTAESRTADLSSADVDHHTLGMDLPKQLVYADAEVHAQATYRLPRVCMT